MLNLRILRRSESWIAVDKPAGFHTHPPENKTIRMHPRWDALRILERQNGETLYPVHRLDRAASGVLLYSRRPEANRLLQAQFAEKKVRKTYFILVRGELRADLTLDSPLKTESGRLMPAVTWVSPCFSFRLPIPHPEGGERIFTVAKAEPETGRFHQIRRHLAAAGKPLLGDKRHGDKKLNREFAALTGCSQIFLRCMSLEFRCPDSETRAVVAGRWSREWHRLFDLAGACPFTALPFRGRPSPS